MVQTVRGMLAGKRLGANRQHLEVEIARYIYMWLDYTHTITTNISISANANANINIQIKPRNVQGTKPKALNPSALQPCHACLSPEALL